MCDMWRFRNSTSLINFQAECSDFCQRQMVIDLYSKESCARERHKGLEAIQAEAANSTQGGF